jgi:hypothetical protein
MVQGILADTQQQQQQQEELQQQQERERQQLKAGKELVRQWVSVLEQSSGHGNSSPTSLFSKTSCSVLNPEAKSNPPSPRPDGSASPRSPTATATANSAGGIANSDRSPGLLRSAGDVTSTDSTEGTDGGTGISLADRYAKPSCIKRLASVSQQPVDPGTESPRSAALDGVRAAVAALKASSATTIVSKRAMVLSVTPLADAIFTATTQPIVSSVTRIDAAARMAALRSSIDLAAGAANQCSGASSPSSVTCLPMPPFKLGQSSFG